MARKNVHNRQAMDLDAHGANEDLLQMKEEIRQGYAPAFQHRHNQEVLHGLAENRPENYELLETKRFWKSFMRSYQSEKMV